MNLLFTELCRGARRSAECLTCITSLSAHNGPMRYAFSSPWFMPAENLARVVRLHTLGKRSRDGVRDANPGLALGGGGHHCLGGLAIHQLQELPSHHIWQRAKALAPSPLEPQNTTHCWNCWEARLGIALRGDPHHPLSPLARLRKEIRGKAAGLHNSGASFHCVPCE